MCACRKLPHRPRRPARAVALALATCALAGPAFVLSGAPARAREQAALSLDIPPLPLPQALARLSRQAGVEVLLQAPGLEGANAPALQGTMTVATALSRLARPFRLTVRRIGPGTFVLSGTLRPASTPRRPQAAPAIASPPLEQGPILVTARRRAERAADVPAAVTALDAASLRHSAVRTLADVARIMPGFVATGQTSSATPLLVMRAQRRSINDENRLPLVVYQNEVPLPNAAALTPLFDVASLEVLRGPQGTLFGRNATSGAVLIRTVQPGSGAPAYAEAEVGNVGLLRLEGAVEMPLAPGLALRLAGQRMRREGYGQLADGTQTDTASSDALRASLRVAPAETWRSTFTFDYFHSDEMGAAPVLVGTYANGGARDAANAAWFDCGSGACDIDTYLARQKQLGLRVSQAGLAPEFRRRFLGLANLTEWGDERLTLRNIAGWRTTDLRYAIDGDGTPLPIMDTVTVSHSRQWTEELQAQGNFGRGHVIVGLFHLDNAPNGPMVQTVAQLVRPGNDAYHIASYQHFVSTALFGQASLPFTESLSADLGLRLTTERTRSCSLRSTTLAPESRAACLDQGGSLAHASSRKLTWTLALTRRRGDFTLYATTRRAFRSGGTNTPTLGGSLAAYQTFAPETLTDLEVGAKGAWQMAALRGTYAVSAYGGLYDKVQRILFPEAGFDGDDNSANDPITFYVNSASARVAGLDGEFTASLGPNSQASLRLAWVDARYTGILVPAALRALLGDQPLHNRFTYSPAFSGTLALSHRFALPTGHGALDVRADLSRTSSVRFTERVGESFAAQPGYNLLGTSLAWTGSERVAGAPDSGGIEVELWVRNLANVRYGAAGGTLNPVSTAATVIMGPPRTFGLRLRTSFR